LCLSQTQTNQTTTFLFEQHVIKFYEQMHWFYNYNLRVKSVHFILDSSLD